MNRLSNSFFAGHRLCFHAPQLLAPIVEETTPKPPAAKSTPKKEEQAKKPTPSKPTISSFVGTWNGTVFVVATSNIGLNTSGNASRTVRISSDGGVVWFGQSANGQVGPQYTSRATVSKDGRGLSWICQQNEQGGILRGTFFATACFECRKLSGKWQLQFQPSKFND